jgi:STE24 endopeptidase
MTSLVVALTISLLVLRWLAQVVLERLNANYALRHAGKVPDAFKDVVDEENYARSINYTQAKSKLELIELTLDGVVLGVVLFSGILPFAWALLTRQLGAGIWPSSVFLFLVGLVMSLPALPLTYYRQFVLEQEFGFNTTTPRLWVLDRVKGLVLATVLALPLLALILKIVQWAGAAWWLWAWAAMMLFQLLMVLIAPVLILPLFNKFSPLPNGTLRDKLLALAGRTQFHARNIQVMDGSKRSTHSNAFFTGFGRFRKIVLFDTLIQQLIEPELEAVLAHEIGHYKRRHIPKSLGLAAICSLVGFYVLSVLMQQEWFYRAFGFQPGQTAIAFLLFALVSGLVTFWFSPLAHWLSRRHEFEADAYAARVMASAEPLMTALRKLNEKNLSNLTPHPLYSTVYYSHPTLLEREAALKGAEAVMS